VFREVAERGTLTAAAAALGYTQSAVRLGWFTSAGAALPPCALTALRTSGYHRDHSRGQHPGAGPRAARRHARDWLAVGGDLSRRPWSGLGGRTWAWTLHSAIWHQTPPDSM
jgi:hypothetical protein